MERCYWIKLEDGVMAHIPACMGAAISGPSGCTCDVPLSEVEAARNGRAIAEQRIAAMREKLQRQAERCNDLFSENFKLRKMLREAPK